jgi:hypothetical protein
MPIEFACGCGRLLRAPDHFSGKHARCPSCGASVRIPGPKNGDGGPEPGEKENGPRFVERKPKLDSVPSRAPDPATEKYDAEVVEEDAPAPQRLAAKAPPTRNDAAADEERERPRKKRKRKKSWDAKSRDAEGMALLYGSQTPAELSYRMQEERERKSGRGILGRLLSYGVRINGVHISGGVILGTGMLSIGLLCLLGVGARVSRGEVADPSAIVGALICIAVGGFALLRSLIFGQED